ncbi:competence protein ComGF [Oenococcus sp. UCMA 16435]|nr:competence protein ComGF [Oenococcus sp. UCMA 16435]MDI4584834.1 competence protein ComGF [Oenococcus sp. UCMA 14587]MDN6967593.1 competence protein ComGF [Oenococcus sp. UCMA 17063]
MKKNRQKSFTILETIISLGIFALIILIIQFAIQYIKNEKQTTNIINFQRMLLQLEDPSRSYHWSQTKEGKIYLLTSEKNNQRVNFRLKNHVFQLTTSDGGTMPIISQIENFKLSLVHERICLSLHFDTGEHYESNLLLEKYKHEEK